MPGVASPTDRDSGGILPVRLFCHTGSGKGVVPHRIRHGGNGGGTPSKHRFPVSLCISVHLRLRKEVGLHHLFEKWFMRYVIDWSKGIAKIYRYEDVRQTQLTDILFVCLNYPGLSTMLRAYYYDKDGNVTGMKDHLEGFRLCLRQALYIGNRYTRRCRSRKHPEAGVIRHQSTIFKRWRYFFRDRKGKRWMLIIDDATGKVISKEERPGKDIDEWMIRHGRFYN